MLFNSGQFLFFFPIVLLTFFLLPSRWRIYLLFLASSVFYMAFIPQYLLILYAIILIDYFAGRQIARSDGGARKAWLWCSLAANIGLLAVFKYFHFMQDNALAMLQFLGLNLPPINWNLILPIGLSFHTFQAMSYTIEVYRGKHPPENSLIHYAVYVLFFPQLVAGPIERPQNLLHQFHSKQFWDTNRFIEGARTMLWGYFKKMAIADLIAPVVSSVYSNPHNFSGVYLFLATVFFSVQIYCDFSGYSDIAQGCAHIMGFKLMTNFRQPYLSKSISEFWRRWHVSLSTWFRDYLYIPLGGNRVEPWHWCSNLLIVFTVSGLWHGASWNFVIWGGMHGLFLIAAILIGRIAPTPMVASVGGAWGGTNGSEPFLKTLLSTLMVFLLASVAWVFFRAATLADSWWIVSHMFRWTHFNLETLWNLGLPRFEVCVSFVAITILFAIDISICYRPAFVMRLWAKRPFRWLCFLSAVYWLVFFGVTGRVEFIYFQF